MKTVSKIGPDAMNETSIKTTGEAAVKTAAGHEGNLKAARRRGGTVTSTRYVRVIKRYVMSPPNICFVSIHASSLETAKLALHRIACHPFTCSLSIMVFASGQRATNCRK